MAETERSRVESFGHLEDGLRDASDWYVWGPYVSERQWGTVREDYSADGEAWNSFPHDHARSRAYRWGEDGLAGFSDIEQRLCLGLSLWNGRDPILKERVFGLAGPQGNHGEDAKEYWWFLDAVPSHAWNRWRYHYPHAEFPYERLIEENARRGKFDPEFELLDTGAFDEDRYWVVDVDYAKADPFDVLWRIRVTNAGPDPQVLHVLPTAWFRNTWSWGDPPEPLGMRAAEDGASLEITHPWLGELELLVGAPSNGDVPEFLFCENETDAARVFGAAETTPYPKDGIGEHVISGAGTVNPDRVGTKAAAWYRLEIAPQATVELRLRLRPAGSGGDRGDALGDAFDRTMREREAEADAFYAELAPADATADEALVMRQAFAGLLWCKQFYAYDVARWLDGDPGQPAPSAERAHGRNAAWRNLDAFDILSMPDTWEYPWFAAWDLAFHCVALAHIDPAFAKYQLILLCREWFQHPSGAIPAYEWNFDDVNPPVQAWAALEVYLIDGARDTEFLSRVFDKLLVNFTWWVNRLDADGSNLFEGGFLGLDNIGPIDRSHLQPGVTLEQSDATAWMAAYSIVMVALSVVLRDAGRPTDDLVVKFLEHFALISEAMRTRGVWDEDDGLYYDLLRLADGTTAPVKVPSMVSVIPILATAVIDEDFLQRASVLNKRFIERMRQIGMERGDLETTGMLRGEAGSRQLLVSLVEPERLERVLRLLLDEREFLSPHGLRGVSARLREQPYELHVDGVSASIDYEPAESTTGMFGGNSNWRGPVWLPLNYLVIGALERYHRFFGDSFTVELPTGSGNRVTLDVVADELRRRLVSLYVADDAGRRAAFGGVERFQRDPRWKDNLLFYEYFNGDDGAGLGASHQTGWTALIADMICRRARVIVPLGATVADGTRDR
jgi:hypothetical protein